MMTLLDHIKELRKRIIVSCIVYIIACIVIGIFYDPILAFFTSPFNGLDSSLNQKLFITSIFEGFGVELKFCLLMGAIVSFPFHLLNLLRFIFPGLKRKEKILIIWSVLASAVLSGFGFYLIYFKIIPYSIEFLMGSGFIPKNVGIMLKFEQNLFYVMNFLIFSILVFQLPILLEIMLYLNLITRKTLLKYGRFIVLGIFILAAIVTPPDFISQCGLAIPLTGLFYLTILIAKIFGFGNEK